MPRRLASPDRRFVAGQELWLRGRRVVFLDYYGGGARVRRDGDDVRIVSVERLALDRADSLRLATTIPAAPRDP